jgi:Ca2+-binding EF-hand superfamily protein
MAAGNLMQELDADGDGKVSYEEASKWPRMTEELFGRMDTNGDGYLTPEDRPQSRRGEGRFQRFEELDADNSGGLSYEEAKDFAAHDSGAFCRTRRGQ